MGFVNSTIEQKVDTPSNEHLFYKIFSDLAILGTLTKKDYPIISTTAERLAAVMRDRKQYEDISGLVREYGSWLNHLYSITPGLQQLKLNDYRRRHENPELKR